MSSEQTVEVRKLWTIEAVKVAGMIPCWSAKVTAMGDKELPNQPRFFSRNKQQAIKKAKNWIDHQSRAGKYAPEKPEIVHYDPHSPRNWVEKAAPEKPQNWGGLSGPPEGTAPEISKDFDWDNPKLRIEYGTSAVEPPTKAELREKPLAGGPIEGECLAHGPRCPGTYVDCELVCLTRCPLCGERFST